MTSIIMPSFCVEKLPSIRLKSIRIENLKAFKDYTFNFYDENGIKNFICFIGTNGTGKSTLLNAIQLIFSNFNGVEKDRLNLMLGRLVRHVEDYKDNALTDEDFLVTAILSTDTEDYEVQINRNGFIKNHPEHIRELSYRLCYTARFDQDLTSFQLDRTKWDKFKLLFESITGFSIEEQQDFLFGNSEDDPIQNEIMKKYVLGFLIKKHGREVIHNKECSAGERKLIKSFSTLLSLEFTPQIILIDNIEMHIDISRHLKLIKAMKVCYPNSQLFTTTHSYHISRSVSERSQVYDLRIMYANPVVAAEPWRLQIIDILNDGLMRMGSVLMDGDKKSKMPLIGESLISSCENDKSDIYLRERVIEFLANVDKEYINNIIK